MTAVDSSVAIAAFGEWHVLNAAACSVLDQGAAIPAHALIGTYSVLTGFFYVQGGPGRSPRASSSRERVCCGPPYPSAARASVGSTLSARLIGITHANEHTAVITAV